MTTAIVPGAHQNGRIPTPEITPLTHHALPTIGNDASSSAIPRDLRDDNAAKELIPPKSALIPIPELDSFDQEDLNNNPIFNRTRPTPLIGTLLIEAKLISHEQLNACLRMQEQDFPDLPIGQILLRCGYVSQEAIDQVLDMQMEHRSAFISTLEAQTRPLADLTALILHKHSSELASGVLSRLGVYVTPVFDWSALESELARVAYDMVIIDGNQFDDTAVLPDPAMPLLVLPSTLCVSKNQIPRWGKAMIVQFVAHVRAQRRQQDAHERLYQRETQLSIVAEMTRAVTAENAPGETLMHLMAAIRDLFGVEVGTLYRFDRAASQLVFEVVLGPHSEALYQERLPIDRGIAGWVVRHGEAVLIRDVQSDPRFENTFDSRGGFQTRSVLCVPLIARGEICGVIQLINKLNGEFNQRDLVLLCILAAIAALAKAADWGAFEIQSA